MTPPLSTTSPPPTTTQPPPTTPPPSTPPTTTTSAPLTSTPPATTAAATDEVVPPNCGGSYPNPCYSSVGMLYCCPPTQGCWSSASYTCYDTSKANGQYPAAPDSTGLRPGSVVGSISPATTTAATISLATTPATTPPATTIPPPPPSTTPAPTTAAGYQSLVVAAHNAARDGTLAAKTIGGADSPAGFGPGNPTPNPALSPFTWSTDLADLATSWASTLASQGCAFAHNPNPSTTGGLTANDIGENIFRLRSNSVSAAPQPEVPVKYWAAERNFYNYAANTCSPVAPDTECLHYTQIVWRSTTQVGCAQLTCPVQSQTSLPYGWIIVCNYTPSGNWAGERPY